MPPIEVSQDGTHTLVSFDGSRLVLEKGQETRKDVIEAFFAEHPSEPPPEAPSSVTMRQARLALLQTGHLQYVAQALAVLPSPQREAAQIEWEYATEVHLESPLVGMLTGALGLKPEEVRELFLLAATF